MSVGGGLEIGVKFNLSLPDAQAGPERIPGSFVPPPKHHLNAQKL